MARLAVRWSKAFYRLVASPSVVWFGLPTAVTWAVWTEFDEYGYAWRALWSVRFVIRFGIALLVIGIGAGTFFGAAMRWAGFDAKNRRSR
jgi:hypothetical protein